MSIQQAYNQWSTTYDADRNRTRDLDQAVTRQCLAGLHCQAILELGCGTGKNTALYARAGQSVHALDFSAGMIGRARAKTTARNVTFSVADLTKPWPCADRTADLVACNLVLEHIKNLSFICSEASRILVESGLFFVCELHPFRQYAGTQASFQHRQQTVAIEAFVHHISDYTAAASAAGLALTDLREWWHEADHGQPPRLVSLMFEKAGR